MFSPGSIAPNRAFVTVQSAFRRKQVWAYLPNEDGDYPDPTKTPPRRITVNREMYVRHFSQSHSRRLNNDSWLRDLWDSGRAFILLWVSPSGFALGDEKAEHSQADETAYLLGLSH